VARSCAPGDRCAFPRNLTRGTYGGDVNCLQQYLFHQARLPQRQRQTSQRRNRKPAGVDSAPRRCLMLVRLWRRVG
jgi:hypothetical protein